MLPPLGSLIVGPCPECQELVLVFCGRVLPLNKEVMLHASLQEKRDHLMAALVEFLEERVNQLLAEAPASEAEEEGVREDSVSEAVEAEEEELEPVASRQVTHPIDPKEVDEFVRVDLNLLDNKDYFRAVFG